MATHPVSTLTFMAQLLAPLPTDVEQVDNKKFVFSIIEDAAHALEMAILLAEQCKARADVHGYETQIVGRLQGEKARVALLPAHDALWTKYELATLAMARMPALTKKQITRKKRAIGDIWLRADGSFYDALRAAVAADEARLNTEIK